jgi:hypothetical protein
MTTNSGSAKIYQFPARGRFAAVVERDESKPAANLTSSHVVRAVVGGAWYHDEAIQEAARKN